MGKPNAISIIIRWIYILIKQTKGNETSEYLEEKKSTEIPIVVASEKGIAQSKKKMFVIINRMFWKEQRYRVIVPYIKLCKYLLKE